MSFAIQHHAGGVSHRTDAPPRAPQRTEATAAVDALPQRGAGGARYALLDALSEALGSVALPASGAGTPTVAAADAASELADAGAEPSRADLKDALHQFTHELFGLLRPTGSDAPGHGHGRGYAWGRTSPADLAERLDALVQRLQGSEAAAPEAPLVPVIAQPPQSGDAVDVTPPADGAASEVANAASTDAATPADADTLEAPTPSVTPTASPLRDAFERLATALSGDAAATNAPASASDRLVSLLRNMADALRGDTGGDVLAQGSLLDVVA